MTMMKGTMIMMMEGMRAPLTDAADVSKDS